MGSIKTSDHVQDLKDILFDLLKKEKVKTFSVSFDGAGDSGQLEQIELNDKILKKKVEGVKIPAGTQWGPDGKTQLWEDAKTIENVIESVCYEVLEQVCGGWEIDEGSYGGFLFDVKERKVTLDFNERITEVRSREYDF